MERSHVQSCEIEDLLGKVKCYVSSIVLMKLCSSFIFFLLFSFLFLCKFMEASVLLVEEKKENKDFNSNDDGNATKQ